jgi:hydroxymethylglutaryl-CoA lyase
MRGGTALGYEMTLPTTAQLVEVGPRDGLQNESKVLSIATRADFIERAIRAGLTRLEAAAFVRSDRVPQMAGAEELLALLPRPPGVSYIGLVMNRKGFDRAAAAGVDEINVVVLCTDTFGMRNQGATKDQAVAAWSELAALAHNAGISASVTLSAAFGCPFEGQVPASQVLELVKRVAAAGPAEIALADTIGVGVPTQVIELVSGVTNLVPDIPIRCHFHNTRNTGYANVVAALQAGASIFDSSLGGIGGCPFAPNATGNVATEDLAYALSRMGVETGVNLEAAIDAGKWVAGELDIQAPGLVGRTDPFPPR